MTRQAKLEAQEQQRRSADAEANRKSAQLEDLMANITDGFMAVDAGQHYTYVNRRQSEMVGAPLPYFRLI